MIYYILTTRTSDICDCSLPDPRNYLVVVHFSGVAVSLKIRCFFVSPHVLVCVSFCLVYRCLALFPLVLNPATFQIEQPSSKSLCHERLSNFLRLDHAHLVSDWCWVLTRIQFSFPCITRRNLGTIPSVAGDTRRNLGTVHEQCLPNISELWIRGRRRPSHRSTFSFHVLVSLPQEFIRYCTTPRMASERRISSQAFILNDKTLQ